MAGPIPGPPEQADAPAPGRARPGFCPRCDAPIYSDQTRCGYCGGGDSVADFQAVAVLSLLVLSVMALVAILLA